MADNDTVHDIIHNKALSKTYLPVANPDGSSIGGGTQYEEGDIEGTIRGTAVLFEDANDTLAVPSDTKPLPVQQAQLTPANDAVEAALSTSRVVASGTALTPKFAVIDAATSGDNTIVAAVSGKKIRVLACFMVAAGAVTARFESDTGGTALTGQMSLAENGGFVLPFNPVGWFETATSELLNLELGGAVSVDGCLVYVEV